jgi:hypothetical protein
MRKILLPTLYGIVKGMLMQIHRNPVMQKESKREVSL